ncbi:MAG TPA: alpha/beta hydrolase-fold protein [Candidatus Kapabacteria bacterium]|nr:alpha/beta hydrolase-fold protein [Candidatus Kapabacteria bacterium]
MKKTLECFAGWLAVMLVSMAYLPQAVRAQPSDQLTEVRVNLHLAGCCEMKGDWKGAEAYDHKANEAAVLLPLESREWYRSITSLFIARAASRLHDTPTARSGIASAFRHRFSNAVLIRQDSLLVSVIGRPWFDSLATFWDKIHESNREEWVPQIPIVFYPNDSNYPSTQKFPIIFALHGGNDNYRAFSRYWSGVANSAHAIVVVPPGPYRNSEIENSWEYNIDTIAPAFIRLVHDYVIKTGADSGSIYLAGYSQGAQVAVTLALEHPDLFRGAISFSGFIFSPITDSMLDFARKLGTRIYALSGEWDEREFLSRITNIHNRCNAEGIPFQLEFEKAMVHEVPLDFTKRFSDAWSWVREPFEAMHENEK